MSELRVNAIRHTGASSDAVTLASDGSCTVNATNNLWNRNVVINSNFSVNQRGSFTANQAEYTLDRWYHNPSGGTSTITQETQTVGSEIESQDKYLKQSVSTGNNYCSIRYRHEDVKTITPGTWTLSFWAKGTTPPGGLQVWGVQNFGSGGSTGVDIAQQTATALTGSWVRQSMNITIPSLSGKTIGAGSSLQFGIGQGTDTGTGAWELNIANVQFEKGSQMTDYEPPRSYGDELARCQRYFYRSIARGMAPARGAGSSALLAGWVTPVPLRAEPTISKGDDSANGNWNIRAYETDGVSDSANTPTVGTRGFVVNQNQVTIYQTGHSVTDDRVLTIYQGGGYMDFSSEL